MRDIVLNTGWKKTQNVIAWLGFIFCGLIIAWVIAIGLGTYGKKTSYDTKAKIGVLNKTWQKFRFIYGSIVGDLILIGWVIGLLLSFFQMLV